METDTPATKTLSGQPGGLGTLLRAALPAVPGVNRLPGVRKGPRSAFAGLAYDRPTVIADRKDVDAYAAVCGFPRKDTLPLTYPHLLAFPLHMAIMSDQAFPFPAIGTVHLENSISAHRPIAVGEALDVTTAVAAPRAHAKGTALDFVTRVESAGELVWESTSTYLRRGRGDDSAPGGLVIADAPPGGIPWRLPDDLGRRYAAVSGDHNPIHLHPLSARALGFPRHIAHGMWSKARCLAAIENRLPAAVRVEVAFKKPIFLPTTVAFGLSTSGPADARVHTFALTSPKDGSPHLVGRAAPL
jgi:acyl dehydratase